jgi:hypothetical protein
MDAPFQIDLENGTLTFTQVPLRLTPRQYLATFLAMDAATRARDGGINDRWQRYQLRQHLEDGQALGISLYFFNAQLAKVSFGYIPEDEADWSKWSEKKELARAENYRGEIVRQLGRRGRFPWGSADAAYDNKAGAARLWVNYD